jgi:hypothetical protein
MLEDGHTKTTNLTSISLSVYDEAHTLKFTITGTTFTNGVAILVKNAPELTSGESYYAQATITTPQGTRIGTASFNVLE